MTYQNLKSAHEFQINHLAQVLANTERKEVGQGLFRINQEYKNRRIAEIKASIQVERDFIAKIEAECGGDWSMEVSGIMVGQFA